MALEIHNQSQGVKILLPNGGQFGGGGCGVCPRNGTLEDTTLSLSSPPKNNNNDDHQYLKCKLNNYTQISKSAAASDYRPSLMQKPHHIKLSGERRHYNAIGSQRKRKCLDNRTITDSHRSATRIQRFITNRSRTSPKLDLRLSLESTSRSVSSPPSSSCASSSDRIILGDHRRRLPQPKDNDDDDDQDVTTTTTSMVLVGCPRCLMYVMLSVNDPCSSRSCPKCKSSVLLDFLHHEPATTTELAVGNTTTYGRRKMARKSFN